MKKTIFLVILTVFLFSCRNAEIDKNKHTDYIEVDEKLLVWDLEGANNLIQNLDNETKLRYENVISEKKIKLEKLYVLEGIIKKAFYDGDFSELDKYMSLGSINAYKYKILKENDLSEVKVYIGKREFLDNSLNELVVLNFYEDSLYMEIVLQFERDNWFIKSFNEKR